MASSVKQAVSFLVVLAFGLTAVAGLNNIQSVEVYTDTCHQCGMTFLGRIEFQVCYHNATGPTCCTTGILDDPTQDDFNEGTISKFSGDLLLAAPPGFWTTRPRMTSTRGPS